MANTGTGSGSPCGACKFLRRKCAVDCIFAPYFSCEQGAVSFAAIHKIFGASNVSKLLQNVSVHDRCEAVGTVGYEAEARIRDPVYGCVAHIFALQQQVAILQAQLMQVRAQLAYDVPGSQSFDNPSQGNITTNTLLHHYSNLQQLISPQSYFDCIDHSCSDGLAVQGISFKEELSPLGYTRPRAPQNELGELQALALRMLRG